MREFRKDPIVDRWVIVSTERSQRPSDVQLPPATQPPDDCPFCAGREAMTPHEVLAYRASQTAPTRLGGRSVWCQTSILHCERKGLVVGSSRVYSRCGPALEPTR
jgi:galactose-1-phosphate uridylyltransferase